MFLLLYGLFELNFQVQHLFLRLLLVLLLAYSGSDLAQKDVLEWLGDGLTLRPEPARVADGQLLRFQKLAACQMVLHNSIVRLQVLWVILEASTVVELRLVDLVALQVTEREVPVDLRLQKRQLLDFVLQFICFLNRLLAVVIFLDLSLGLVAFQYLLRNLDGLLPAVDGLEILLLLEESVAAVLPVLKLLHVIFGYSRMNLLF